MTAIEYLEQIRFAPQKIKDLSMQLEILGSMETSIKCACDTETVKSSDGYGKMVNAVAEIVEIENQIANEVAEYQKKIQKIKRQIDELSDNNGELYELSRVLDLRYEKGMKFRDIAIEMGYCERHVMRLHSKAVVCFSEKYVF